MNSNKIDDLLMKELEEVTPIYFKLNNEAIKELIEFMIKKQGFQSIKEVIVYDKVLKSKKWFVFTKKKSVTMIKFVVDEGLMVMEALLNDLNLEELADKMGYVEVEYIEGEQNEELA